LTSLIFGTTLSLCFGYTKICKITKAWTSRVQRLPRFTMTVSPFFLTKEKRMRNTATTLISLAATGLLLAACSSTPLKEPEPVAAKPAPAQPDSRTVQTVDTKSVDPLDDPKGELAKRSVYFDYDKYDLRDDGKPVVTAHSKYLVSHSDRKIIVQGNTDERGGSEYNLALGQKRAEAVRKSLTVLGVPEARMEAVSFGKEKPKAAGHDEASWAENRRADIVYASK
jgi:peptidoglycan-associated lipoprotein